jgi:sporulation protein YlmC with PRC-barrel domain
LQWVGIAFAVLSIERNGGDGFMYIASHILSKAVITNQEGDEIARVEDIYFDNASWNIKYFVCRVGHLIQKKDVLIGVNSILEIDPIKRSIRTNFTEGEIASCPDKDEHKPISRLHEERLQSYFGWSPYWGQTVIPSIGTFGYANPVQPNATPHPAYENELNIPVEQRTSYSHEDANLLSLNEISGYHIEASDGSIGHAADWFIDTSNWEIAYLMIDTRNWLPGKKVAVDKAWVNDITWHDRMIRVELNKEEIGDSPEYHGEKILDRDFINNLSNYHEWLSKKWQRKLNLARESHRAG